MIHPTLTITYFGNVWRDALKQDVMFLSAQSNLNGSNIFGTLEIVLDTFEPLRG